jgi:hypothetical protein
MSADGEDSVTRWVSDLKAGDRREAPRLLWERYFQRLAQAHLRTVGGGPADGEDVALSVLDTSIRGAAAGRYPGLVKLEGHSHEEIARSLDCGVRTVERKLQVIGKRWTAEGVP